MTEADDNVFAQYAEEIRTSRDEFIVATVRASAKSLTEQMAIYRDTMMDAGFSAETAEWVACRWADETHFTHIRSHTIALELNLDDAAGIVEVLGGFGDDLTEDDDD